ncbi:MAG: LamG domain-containing protein [Candidatus Brocadiaceae bacterium]
MSALYTFDEGSGATAHDTSGNGNNGTINGATWTGGKYGSALSFNGASSYVSISNSLLAFSEFTCVAWVNAADLVANRGVFTSGGFNTSGFRFRVNKDGSVWLMMAGGGSYTTVLTAAGVIQSGSFYHISVTGKSGQYMRIYVNGVLAKEKITTQTVTTPTAPGYIGTSWSTSSELMKGVIDNVCIYNRALSNQEVMDLYNKNNALPPSGVPAGSISINNGDAYTNSLTVLLNLSAMDNVGVVGYYLSSSDMTPLSTSEGWVVVTSSPIYNATVSYTLSSGEGSKTVYVWYKDGDGNISSTANDSIVVDTTTPVVTITTPSSGSTYTATTNTVNLGGSVAESGSGVSGVVWSSDKGGSGTASGTTSWTIANVNLNVGDTVITVTATDGAGNAGKSTIIVSYSGTSTLGGLGALYTFNEGSGVTANDTSGKGNNGVISGATWTTGKIKSGLKFNGTSSYVSIPRMNFDEVSVSAWFYKNAKDMINVDAVIGGWYWSSNAQLHQGFDVRFSPAAPDTLEFVLVTKNADGTRVLKTAKYNLVNSVGSWFHVVCVYSKGTGEQMLYVNGQLVNTQTHLPGNTVVPLTNYSDVRIGHSRVNKGFFNGTLDEVRFYNRALSSQEVVDLYNAK